MESKDFYCPGFSKDICEHFYPNCSKLCKQAHGVIPVESGVYFQGFGITVCEENVSSIRKEDRHG